MKTIRTAIIFGISILMLIVNAQAQKEELKLEILNGHSSGGVLSVAVSADGKVALTGRTVRSVLLIYVDDDNFPGAYRITGTYETDSNGQITITPFLRKDGKTVANLPKVSGKDINEAAEKLLDAILKELRDLVN